MSSPEQPNPEIYEGLADQPESKIEFTETELAEIERKRQILSSLAYFIGKDFRIPVELNKPGAGWHWDFRENKIRIDPKDLLEKPIDELRYLICHEGGHRRVSRTEFIPLAVWQEPGFSAMSNFIEDPRSDNFVAESYPKYQENIDIAWGKFFEDESKMNQEAQGKLGRKPKFMQAGYEYIKQWFREIKGEEAKISEDLPEDVKAVVSATLESARDSWWRYPSRDEADQSEELISRYAQRSYEINKDQVWPEFKKLVEQDLEDQEIQELLKEMEKIIGEGQGQSQELTDKLTPEEQQILEEAIKKALEEARKQQAEGQEGQPVPIDMDSLSEELKQKIKDYIDSLPEEKKKELQEKAEGALKDFEKELNEEIGGKLSDNPEREAAQKAEEAPKGPEIPEEPRPARPEESEEIRKYRELVERELKKDANVYEQYRREVLAIIDQLEQDLREIFVARRAHQWDSGFRTGKRIDIKKRIQEKAKGVPAMESKAWERRELPSEKDYAISLLVDLSGSMQGEKIDETFKAVIVLAEVLNRLSIQTEILGFNDRLYEYQKFDQMMSNQIRENMGGMLQEVSTSRAQWNDDGWALEQTSERLNRQKAAEKFLIVLSDGQPVESPRHRQGTYELGRMVQKVLSETNQKLIGLGIGPDTEHVGRYYPNSLADVNIQEMAEKLADLIREVIANYDKF